MDKKFLLLLSTCFLLTSCNLLIEDNFSNSSNSEYSESESISPSEEESETTSESNNEEDEENTIFDDFFNINNDCKLTIDFSKYGNSIHKLAEYSKSASEGGSFEKQDMYHPCDVTISINDETYFFEECGARMKGNTSRNPNFVSEDGEIKSLVHFKISFSQTFDDEKDNDYYIRTWEDEALKEERKDRKFGHVKKFDIKWNKSFDNTFTKQAYAYDCYRNEGIYVEKNNLIETTIKTSSDERTEIYLAQECIDKQFLKEYFPKDEAKGNLYKATYTNVGPADYTLDSLSRIGIESNNFRPAYDLKTNDDEDEIDHTVLTNLINIINTKGSAESIKSKLDNVIDVDYMLKYHALAYIIGNPDDSRMNYNNHYVYFNSLTNKAIFIPYDNDRCLGILHDWDKDMSSTWPTTTKDINRNWQKNPLLWRLFLQETDNGVYYSDNYPVIEEYKNKYKDYVIEFADKYLDVDKFEAFTNKFVNAPSKDISIPGGNNPTNQTFAYYCNNKKNAINEDNRL